MDSQQQRAIDVTRQQNLHDRVRELEQQRDAMARDLERVERNTTASTETSGST